MNTISWLVSHCHVGQDHQAVRRYVLSRFHGGRTGFLTLPKPTKRGVFAEISREHRANRETYIFAMAHHGYRPKEAL